MSIDNLIWRRFLFFESELLSTQDYVEFHPKNENTFSIKYRTLILQACSDIEIICKCICDIDPEKQSRMDKYRNYFLRNYPTFYDKAIEIPILKKTILPWAEWKNKKAPEFWKAYNGIKHEGKFEVATLKNTIEALSGLFALLLVYYAKKYGEEFSAENTIEEPKFFDYPGLKESPIVDNGSNIVNILHP